MSWGRPMRMSAYWRSPGGPVQKGHPLNRGTVLRTPRAPSPPDLAHRRAGRGPRRAGEVAEADGDDAQRLPRRQHRGADPGPQPRRVRAQRQRAVGGGAHDGLPGPGEAARPRGAGVRNPTSSGCRRWRCGGAGRTASRTASATPSTAVVYDFLKIAARRARVALPGRVGADGGRPRSADQRRLRRPADDARRGARARAQRSEGAPRLGGNYKATLEVPTAIGPLASRRGWAAADLSLRRQALPLRQHAPRGVLRRPPAPPGDGAPPVAGPLRGPEDRDRHRRHQLRPDRRDGGRPGRLPGVHLRRAEGHVAVGAPAQQGLLVLLQDRDDHGPAAGAVRPPRRPRLRQGQAARARRPRGRQRPGEPHRVAACGRPTTAAR